MKYESENLCNWILGPFFLYLFFITRKLFLSGLETSVSFEEFTEFDIGYDINTKNIHLFLVLMERGKVQSFGR